MDGIWDGETPYYREHDVGDYYPDNNAYVWERRAVGQFEDGDNQSATAAALIAISIRLGSR